MIEELPESETALSGSLAEASVPRSDDLNRYCLLRSAGRLWAVPGDFSKGIVGVGSMIRVPGAPRYIVGVHYRRGRILPILDLAAPFSLPQTQVTLPATALEIAAAGCEVALLCDAVVGFELADTAQLSTLEPDFASGQRWLLGELEFRQGHAALLDIAGLIDELKISAPEGMLENSPRDSSDRTSRPHPAESDHQASKDPEE